jgi:hypothetical protein
MLHPVPIGALALLIANDHLWKGHGPALVTGKLSDLAGLVLFPLLLQALVEVGGAAIGRGARPSPDLLAGLIVVTGCAFAAAQLSPPIDGVLEVAWGWARSPVATLAGAPGPPGVLTQDPTDLLVLPALVIPWLVGQRRASRWG